MSQSRSVARDVSGAADPHVLANMVNVHILTTDGGWLHALTIPLQDIAGLSLRPLKWLRFATFAAVGARGDLSAAEAGNVVDYENVLLVEDLAEDYYFTPEGNAPTPPTIHY
jgi:hypothetical protein